MWTNPYQPPGTETSREVQPERVNPRLDKWTATAIKIAVAFVLAYFALFLIVGLVGQFTGALRSGR